MLPGASLTVTNVETGVTRPSVSGERGEYRIPALAVGTYDVTATTAGFQTGVRQGITLTIGREAVVDFTLQVGNVAERVTVTGEAPLIETTTATVGGVVDSKQMRDIPLNSRSFLELIPLQANAAFSEVGEKSPLMGVGRKISIGGSRYNANLFLLDGANMNDASNTAGSAVGTLAGVETVREFKVITNAYDAEYGRHTGGVVNAVTKSGTNEIHGSLFEFLRNDNLDAAKWEDNAFAGGQKPEYRRNQFGAAVGGPILRDRTFFFGSYEGLREALGQTITFNVPGFTMRSGRLPGSGGVLQTIPVDPAVQPFLLAYPEPNIPCTSSCLGPEYPFDRNIGTGQFSRPANQVTSQNYYTARVDHRISDSDFLFGRLTSDTATLSNPARQMNTSEILLSRNRYSTLEETHIFSSALLGRTHFSFNRTNLANRDDELPGFNYPIWSFDGTEVMGRISVANLSGWGGENVNPRAHILNNFQFKEDLFYTTGRHSFKMGFHFERQQFNQRADYGTGGTFTFASLAEFLRNDVDSANFVAPGSDNIRGWRQNLTGLYFHDDINVRPGLTLNVGVRYEFITVPKEVNGKAANIRDMRDAHFFTVKPGGTDVGDPYFKNPSLKNLAPRVGFAWDPFGTGKTSLRGGFGIYHEQLLANFGTLGTSGVRMPPFYAVALLRRQDLQAVGTSINFPNSFTAQRDLVMAAGQGNPQVFGIEYQPSQPYVMKWGMDIEQQVAPGTILQTGYTGSRGVHLMRNPHLNATPRTFIDDQSFILITQPNLNPNFAWMWWKLFDSTADYHSFRLSINKRFSRGFQFQSSYTFSKSTDDTSSWSGSRDMEAGDRRPYRYDKEHGLSGIDVRQSWVSNFVVDLPGRNLRGAAGKILGGGTVSGILRFNSGHPFNLTAQVPQVRVGTTTFSPYQANGPVLNLKPGADQGQVFVQNPDKYYEPANYALPACWSAPNTCNPIGYFQGSVGRNHIITPGVANVDFVFMKDTAMPRLGERGVLQFRWELFNLFNRPNFGLPGLQVFQRTGAVTPSAGQITDTRTSAREMQLAVKLIF